MALGGVLLIIKWTYDYPLIRRQLPWRSFLRPLSDAGAGQAGTGLFVVALAVIYAQTFRR